MLEHAIPGAQLVPDVGVVVLHAANRVGHSCCSSTWTSRLARAGHAALVKRFQSGLPKRNLVAKRRRASTRAGRFWAPTVLVDCLPKCHDWPDCPAHAPDGRLRNRRARRRWPSARRRLTSRCRAPTARAHSLADYADSRVLAVVFTCNHCPASQLYEARIAKLYEDYRNQGVAVVAINPTVRRRFGSTS